MAKNKTKKKGKGLKIVLAVVLILLLGVGVAAAFVASKVDDFYDSSNYVSDEDAMDGFTQVGEEAPIEEEEQIYPTESPEDTEEGENGEDPEVTGTPEDTEVTTTPEGTPIPTEKPTATPTPEIPVKSDSSVYNVMLIGVDRRDKSWAGNSDAMILMSLNYDKKQISMISLMRDTYVYIPGIGKRKLNAAHANGAGPLLLKTVEQNYKVDVNRYVSVDFESMSKIIDKMGGITLTISDAEAKVANGYISEMCSLRKLDPNKYYVSGGTRTCNGIQAVAYARIRYVGNADYQRTERQRTVLTKMIEKMKGMSVAQLTSLAEDVLPLVTHNIPQSEMWDLIGKAPSLLSYKLVKDRIPYNGMYSSVYVNKQNVLQPNWSQTIDKLHSTLY